MFTGIHSNYADCFNDPRVAAMCRYEKAMTAFILAVIATCLVFGPRPVGVFFAILLAAALSRPRGDRGDIMQ